VSDRSLCFTQFFHRRNDADSTFDSVCGLCFQTVATVADREALESLEMARKCRSANVIPFVRRKHIR
jgi:hypothetical protein